MINNKKVERNNNISGEFYKYIPINSDLFDLLMELGYNEKKTSNDFRIFCKTVLVHKDSSIHSMFDYEMNFSDDKPYFANCNMPGLIIKDYLKAYQLFLFE